MDIRYEEWLPDSSALAALVPAYWRVSGDGSHVPSSAVLPDGHVELVFNLGAPVGLSGPAYRGDQPQRAVVGPLSKALRLEYQGPVDTFGIRFHPARGAGFFGRLATQVVEKLLPLAEVSANLDRAVARLLAEHPNAGSDVFRAALDQVLLQQLPLALPPDTEVIAMVDRLAGSDSLPPVAQIARELGISTRQLQRRFLAAVGMAPKRFVRVLRFARVWQLASMSPRETWAGLAAAHGYSDQAHLVREFRAFGAEPPTHIFTSQWYDSTGLARLSGPAPGVRFVQDSGGKTRYHR
jgi:AraC-like DNA-binding protein